MAKSSTSGSRGPAGGAAGTCGAPTSGAAEMMTICEESSSRSAPAPSRASSAGARWPPPGATAMALRARVAREAGGGGGAGPWRQAAARARSRSAPGRRCLQSPGHFYAPNPFCRERATRRRAPPPLVDAAVTEVAPVANIGCSVRAGDGGRDPGRGGQSRGGARAGFVRAVRGSLSPQPPAVPRRRRGRRDPAPSTAYPWVAWPGEGNKLRTRFCTSRSLPMPHDP